MDKKEFQKQKREIERNEAKHKAWKLKSSLVPGGAKAYDLFTVMVQPFYEKRKDEWIHLLMNDLARREEGGLISLEALSKNEEFITIVTKATLLAQQNHQKEKLEALRNLVLNVATKLQKESIEYDLTTYFLSILDRITPIHIALLNTFHDPDKVIEERKVDLSSIHDCSQKRVFLKIYPELRKKAELIDLYWDELASFGLVTKDSIRDLSSIGGSLNELSTKLGGQFLEMIKNQE
ncbi:MAG: hypothetical protein GVY20_12735 [Bacteroidetes bacterium]|jgi:hypothetical protein|nr:hypothetical protein [Bacteroidota bacterium]